MYFFINIICIITLIIDSSSEVCFDEAMANNRWREVVHIEMNAYEHNSIWKFDLSLENEKLFSTKWILETKVDHDSSIILLCEN